MLILQIRQQFSMQHLICSSRAPNSRRKWLILVSVSGRKAVWQSCHKQPGALSFNHMRVHCHTAVEPMWNVCGTTVHCVVPHTFHISSTTRECIAAPHHISHFYCNCVLLSALPYHTDTHISPHETALPHHITFHDVYTSAVSLYSVHQ